MNDPKYIGINLLYLCGDRPKLFVVQKSFISIAGNLVEVQSIAKQLAKTAREDVKLKNCTYLGIRGLFEITGPLKAGAILGKEILWSYKRLISARKLLRPERNFWFCSEKDMPTKEYIADIVFLLTSPVKYTDRRTVVCHVFIGSLGKAQVLTKAIKIGTSRDLKEKLFKVLLQYEPNLLNELEYVGIANIKSAYDKIEVGKCFEALYKPERCLSSAKKLVSPITKFSDYLF